MNTHTDRIRITWWLILSLLVRADPYDTPGYGFDVAI
jgi:hypothetical protein